MYSLRKGFNSLIVGFLTIVVFSFLGADSSFANSCKEQAITRLTENLDSFEHPTGNIPKKSVWIVQGGASERRAREAAAQYKKYNPEYYIVTGYDGKNGKPDEIKIMTDILLDARVPRSKILQDPDSKNTFAHPININHILYGVYKYSERPAVVLVTDDFHTMRSAGFYRSYGFPVDHIWGKKTRISAGTGAFKNEVGSFSSYNLCAEGPYSDAELNKSRNMDTSAAESKPYSPFNIANFTDKKVMIRSMYSGKCLDFRDRRNGGRVHQWECNTKNVNQHIYLKNKRPLDKEHNYFSVQHAGKTPLCLDVKAAGTSNGSVLHSWNCIAVKNQIFQFVRYKAYGGRFRIKDLNSGKCLMLETKENRAQYIISSCKEDLRQVFEVRDVDTDTQIQRPYFNLSLRLKGKPVLLQSARSSRCLFSQSNGVVFQADCDKNIMQQRIALKHKIIDGAGSEYFQVEFTGQNRCLKASDRNVYDSNPFRKGERVTSSKCSMSNFARQRFNLIPTSLNTYMLQAQDTNKCVDLAGGKLHNRAYFHLWDCRKENVNQQFKIVTADLNKPRSLINVSGIPSYRFLGKTVNIQSMKSRKCLDTKGNMDGSNFHQWSCNKSNKNQNFSLDHSNDKSLRESNTFLFRSHNGLCATANPRGGQEKSLFNSMCSQSSLDDYEKGQRFITVHVSNNVYLIKDRSSGYCLNLINGKVDNKAKYNFITCNKNDENQHFRFLDSKNGMTAISPQ